MFRRNSSHPETVKTFQDRINEEYIRPEPLIPDYLATATAPVPWHTPGQRLLTTHRPSRPTTSPLTPRQLHPNNHDTSSPAQHDEPEIRERHLANYNWKAQARTSGDQQKRQLPGSDRCPSSPTASNRPQHVVGGSWQIEAGAARIV